MYPTPPPPLFELNLFLSVEPHPQIQGYGILYIILIVIENYIFIYIELFPKL